MVCCQDLKKIHLFEQLPDNVLHQFEQAAIPLQYRDGQIICLDDEGQLLLMLLLAMIGSRCLGYFDEI